MYALVKQTQVPNVRCYIYHSTPCYNGAEHVLITGREAVAKAIWLKKRLLFKENSVNVYGNRSAILINTNKNVVSRYSRFLTGESRRYCESELSPVFTCTCQTSIKLEFYERT